MQKFHIQRVSIYLGMSLANAEQEISSWGWRDKYEMIRGSSPQIKYSKNANDITVGNIQPGKKSYRNDYILNPFFPPYSDTAEMKMVDLQHKRVINYHFNIESHFAN